jgi:hypothetical protein
VHAARRDYFQCFLALESGSIRVNAGEDAVCHLAAGVMWAGDWTTTSEVAVTVCLVTVQPFPHSGVR